ARDQRISVKPGARPLCVVVCGFGWHGDVEQRVWNGIRREERETVEEAAAFRGQFVERRRPSCGKAHVVVVAHQGLIEPTQHPLALLAPQREIASETDSLDSDIRASLLEPKRETAEFVSYCPGLGCIVSRDSPILTRPH